jgi:hypothetical protein
MTSKFHFKGLYQVQSRRQKMLSELVGKWIHNESCLSSAEVNRYLEVDQLWGKEGVINIAGAYISHRTGLFASDPDILVKTQFFLPDPNSEALPCDLIDVQKAINLWDIRIPYVKKIFKNQAADLLDMVKPLDRAIINEYLCHEAGHCLGYPVRKKYEDGFFKLNRSPVWPLIYTEEFRADLHSFGLSVTMLNEQDAIQIFLYNILLRFGVEAFSIHNNNNAYGSVPFLLFSFLLSEGAFRIERNTNTIKFTSLEPAYLKDLMKKAYRHAEQSITVYDFNEDKSDTAIAYVNYFRSRILQREVMELYEAVFLSFRQ